MKPSDRPSMLTRVRKLSLGRGIIFAVPISLIGAIVILLASASGTPSAFEPETGVLTSPAISVAISGGSGGSGVKFSGPTTPSPTPIPTPSPSNGAVTNGRQINLTNTGYLAYVGPSGERCTDANLHVYSTRPSASSLGASVYCAWFQLGINIDAPITITASRIDDEVYTNNFHVTLNYVTAHATTPQDYAIGPQNFDATRSQLTGSSDGVRFENASLTEDYISVALQSTLDHNDAVQAYMAGSAGSILRCNIQAKPVNQGSTGIIGSSGVFFADSSEGTLYFRDNYVEGGVISMRFNENMFYHVTGNIVKPDPQGSPLTTANSRPGAFLEWSNNTLSDGTPLPLN